MAENKNKVLVLTRIIDAPRDLVYKAWTDEKQMIQWWGPKYFTNTNCRVDLRVGGEIRVDMKGPDGTIYPMKGIFTEVKEMEKLVFNSVAIEDKEGRSLMEVMTTAIFEEDNGKTKLTVKAEVTKSSPGAEQAIAGMDEGWNQTLDRLEEFVSKQ